MKKIVLVITSLIFVSCSLFQDNSRKFSKESWNNDPDHRYEMVNDLKNNYLFIGMDRTDVIELLGEPDSNDTAYYLGYPGYFSIDPEILDIIYFDDKISSIWVGEG